MSSFGATSRRHRDSCHADLRHVLDDAIKRYNFSCIWGHRGEDRQNKAFADGHSTKRWPNSRHNQLPSQAFDVIPYPDGFKASDKEFYLLASHILASAAKLGVPLRWGGHWKNLKDLAHFELIGTRT